MSRDCHRLDHKSYTSRCRQITMPPIFYRLDALPDTQQTLSKHWRQKHCYWPEKITHFLHQCWTQWLISERWILCCLYYLYSMNIQQVLFIDIVPYAGEQHCAGMRWFDWLLVGRRRGIVDWAKTKYICAGVSPQFRFDWRLNYNSLDQSEVSQDVMWPYLRYNTHTIVLQLFWNLSGTTRVSRYQKGKNQEGKPIWIYWSKR